MEGHATPEGVEVAGDARQRFHDARGYGAAGENGTVQFTPVEAAHLLYRGDLSAVDGQDFAGFVSTIEDADFATRFATFADLRARGYYLDPAHRDGVPLTTDLPAFAVYERGAGRSPDAVAFAVYPVSEETQLKPGSLPRGVLAIVDGEGEVGYITVESISLEGACSNPDQSSSKSTLAGDSLYLWDAPPSLYRDWFIGRPLEGRDAVDSGPLVVSLLEGAYLSELGLIDIPTDHIIARGRALAGDRFVRRLAVYRALREAGVVPKSGYKFGADFRVYDDFSSLDTLGHSSYLVRVTRPDISLLPAALSQDVRLAHGVGKRMVFAITTGSEDRTVTWRSVTRKTP